jgi:ribosomal-protein-alanine N-acetyltransferase
MKLEIELPGDRLYLQEMKVSDITPEFVQWLTDPEVNNYLEVRHNPPDLERQIAYVQECEASIQKLYLGVFLKNSRLIGSTTLTAHSFNKVEIGLMIGDKSLHGQGYGSEIVQIAIRWAKLAGFHEITAGYLENNMASANLFFKLGFREAPAISEGGIVREDCRVIRTSLLLKACED